MVQTQAQHFPEAGTGASMEEFGRRGSSSSHLAEEMSKRGSAAPLAATGGGAAASLPEVHRGVTVSTEDEVQALMRRLWKSDELIKQLKHIVKAQHGKIEELREKLDSNGPVQEIMTKQEMGDLSRVMRDNEEFRKKANRAQAELVEVKKDNQNLRKVNRRLKAMVEDPWVSQAAQDFLATQSEAAAWPKQPGPPQTARTSRSSVKSPRAGMGSTFGSGTGSGTLGSGRWPAPSDAAPGAPREDSPDASQSPKGADAGGKSGGAPAFSKISRLNSCLAAFWRDLGSPCNVLRVLVELAGRMLSERPSTVITVYLMDPWLRACAGAEEKKAGREAAPLFYLGQGKAELQIFTIGGQKPEPPRFADVQELPYRTRTAVAVPVRSPQQSGRILAVLQAVCVAEEAKGKGQEKRPGEDHTWAGEEGRAAEKAAAPRVLRKAATGIADPGLPAQDAGFTDQQLNYLTLICIVSGGVVIQMERQDERQHVLERMRGSVDVAVMVNKARTLPDFEQRVKHMMSTYFNVSIVRLLFYDADSQKLLMSSTSRARDCAAYSIDKGIIGLCAKRQQVLSVADISLHPYIDPQADGIQRSGRPVKAHAAMLCGPLIVDSDEAGHDTPKLLGVVQLIERKKAKGGDPGGEFSAEDQSLFVELLSVCAHVAWRTLRVQELSAQLSGESVTLAWMMTG